MSLTFKKILLVICWQSLLIYPALAQQADDSLAHTVSEMGWESEEQFNTDVGIIVGSGIDAAPEVNSAQGASGAKSEVGDIHSLPDISGEVAAPEPVHVESGEESSPAVTSGVW